MPNIIIKAIRCLLLLYIIFLIALFDLQLWEKFLLKIWAEFVLLQKIRLYLLHDNTFILYYVMDITNLL